MFTVLRIAVLTSINQSHVFIKLFFTSADVTKCCTETQPKTPNSKQCRCSTVARKNSLEREEPRKKPREEPGSEGWPVLFWPCRVEITRVRGHLRPPHMQLDKMLY
jgi:hypothetical protein